MAKTPGKGTTDSDDASAGEHGERAASEHSEEKSSIKLPHQKERTQFRALIVANPNYFGNLDVSPFKPVLKVQGDTTYEQLTCVGLNPPYDRLEGIIHVKLDAGYGGDICGPGSREYVRF